MVSDRSPSQDLGDRPRQLAEAEAALRERLERMPGVELRELSSDGESRQGTPPVHPAAARRWPRATARGWAPWWR